MGSDSSYYGRLLNQGNYLITYAVSDPWWPTTSHNVFVRMYLKDGTSQCITDLSDGH